MKKNNYLLILLCLVFGIQSNVNGQASSYSMTPSIGAFTPVTGGTRIATVEQDFGISAPITIPFSFVFEGTSYTQCRVTSDGYLTFNATGATFSNGFGDLDNGAANQRPLVAPLWDDMDGSAPAPNDSKFEHVTTGTVGSRIMTFEWLNWEWNWNASVDVISFQVKLYEGTNVIDFVYRQESGAVSGGSASIGLSGVSSFLSLQSTSTSPLTSSTVENDNISTRPATGQIYKFTPPTCPAPSALTQTSATGTSIDLSWTTGGATNWQVDYGTIGHLPGTGTITTTTATTATLVGLANTSCFDVFVRDSCAPGDVSNWLGPIQMCTAWNAPFLEDFEGNVATNLGVADRTFYGFSNGWSAVSNSSGSIWNWLPENTTTSSGWGPVIDHTTGSGIFMYAENSGGTSGDSAWLYSPYIDLTAVTNPTIRLWYHKRGGTSLADIIVEGDSAGFWIVLDNTTMIGATHSADANSDPWDELLVPLTGFSGITRIRVTQIKNVCCEDGAIDDFEIFDLLNRDFKMIRLVGPADGGCEGGGREVIVEIQNNGKDTITSFDVAYQIDGGTPVKESVNVTVLPFDKYEYTFTTTASFTAGVANILAWTELSGDGFTGNDTLEDTAKVIISPVISEYLYCYGFENGNEGWSFGGTASSWAIGVPAASFISAAAQGNNAAVTNLTGQPNINEDSYMQSPCFDFSEFENDPTLEFSHIYDVQGFGEISFLEMSKNGGITWTLVGAFGQGINWYDNTANNWNTSSGSSGVWRKARIKLDGAAGEEQVKIRFVFRSDGFVSTADDGVGVDDVAIVVPPNDLFLDTVSTCNDPNFELDASGIYPDTLVGYMWSTGDTTERINVTTPGTYSVVITDKKIGLSKSETIEVIAQAAPAVTFATVVDTLDINGLPVAINLSPALPASYSYTWTSTLGTSNYPFFVADPVALGLGLHTITAEVVDNVGCTGLGQHAVFVSATVGVPTIGDSQVGYYPNPTSDQLTLELNGSNALGQLKLTILDYQGRTVYQQQLVDQTGTLKQTIDVSELGSGMYLIQLQSSSATLNHKLVIE
jgi:hypothetical protein